MQKKTFPIKDEQFWPLATKAVLSYVNKRFPKFFSEEDKEDMASEVVLRMYRAKDRYDGEKGALSTWVGTIAKNVVRSAARAQWNRSGISEHFEDGVFTDDQPWSSHRANELAADGDLLRKELRESLRSRLKSERDRRFLDWQIDGLDAKEMARREGIPVENVHMVLFHMRQRLGRAA
jgi:RNA polymerase sigma factor (sigma-70 family)